MYPDAFIITVNGACIAIEHVDAIVAGHTNKSERFTEARRTVFPDSEFEVWANWARRGREPKHEYPSVTKWFGGEMSTGATSAAKAARMALHEGFEPVILCGCPLTATGYFEGESQKGVGIGHDCRRVGDPEMDAHRTIRNYRDKFAKLAQNEFQGRVFSMSGRTRKLLGEPPC
jgi:hypothetical protein